MELMLVFIGLFIIIFILSLFNRGLTETKARNYKYIKKESVMTKTEQSFFDSLQQIIGNRFYIIPQAHLSSFLDGKVKGQNWKAAFHKINGKSVDFLLCDKFTSKPMIAIELDDYTHERNERVERDKFVESICEDAGLLLVRFKDGEWKDKQAIFDKIVMQKDLWESHKAY